VCDRVGGGEDGLVHEMFNILQNVKGLNTKGRYGRWNWYAKSRKIIENNGEPGKVDQQKKDPSLTSTDVQTTVDLI